jgi:DNA-binding NtrC family response regulator
MPLFQVSMNECVPLSPLPPVTAAAPSRWLDWRGSGCILVIDDDEAIRTVVSRTVARLGFTSVEASGGQQAVALFESDPGRYALVLLDFMLPGMDGLEILSRLQQIRPDVRVILMSGLGRQDAVGQFVGQGVAGFLQKPFPLEAMVTELRAVLKTA